VFGIDFGSALSRVAVVDPERGQPVVLTNPEDGALYWHNAVAVDKATGEVLVGRGAKEMVHLVSSPIYFRGLAF
jgi:molecular chaperone DnaK (HSP70)